MSRAVRHRLLIAAFVAAPLAFGAAGCESMSDAFAPKQTRLPGDRQPLFPEGVPGVEFGAPPPQPTNSNIPISPSMAAEQQELPQAEERPQPQAARTPPARSSKAGDPNDAWSGTR